MPQATKTLGPPSGKPPSTPTPRPPMQSAPSYRSPGELPEPSRASMLPPLAPIARDPLRKLERRLNREILVSERLRVTILAAIPGVLLVLFLGASTAYPELLDRVIGRADRARVGLFLALISAYELWGLHTFERLIKKEQEPPAFRRYLNALVETSIPTLVIFYYAAVIPPAEALLMPPTFIYFVFILLSTLRLNFSLCVFTGTVAAVEYGCVAMVVVGDGHVAGFDAALTSTTHHGVKAAILFVSGVAAGFVAQRLRKAFVNTLLSLDERNRIRNVFGQHVSPAVVDQLLMQKADIRSEVRDVCIMFLDVRNFTGFAEKRTPQEVVEYLNSLFEFMIGSVNRHHGIVNKFLGDGFMAVFGAPISTGNDCENAIEASLEIVGEVERMVESGSIPATRIGIGLHLGRVVVGNVGSGTRKEYTVIGDAVNVAARIESLNKELGTQVLVSERVWEASGRKTAEGDIKPKKPLYVKGREEPVQIYELA